MVVAARGVSSSVVFIWAGWWVLSECRWYVVRSTFVFLLGSVSRTNHTLLTRGGGGEWSELDIAERGGDGD